MSASAVVYLTDGFDRLNLAGRLSVFELGPDWVARGTTCYWTWPHADSANIAGAEVELVGTNEPIVLTIEVEDLAGPPQIVNRGQEITFTPYVRVLPNRSRAADDSPTM